MSNCAFIHCTNHSKKNPNLRFYSLPSVVTNSCKKSFELSERRRREWLAIIARKDGPETKKTGYKICSEHFVSGKPAYFMCDDNIDWIPTLKTSLRIDEGRQQQSAGRHERRLKRRRTTNSAAQFDKVSLPEEDEGFIQPQVEAIEVDANSTAIDNNSSDDSDDSGIGCQTDEIDMNDFACQFDSVLIITEPAPSPITTIDQECQTDITGSHIEGLNTECYNLRKELNDTKVELLNASNVSRESLSQNDKMVSFYTGLPSFALLIALYNHIEGCVENTHRNALSKFNEILLTLMKLRLNVPLKDLAFRFNISESTAGRVFEKWVHVMNDRLAPLVKWPDREDLRKTMPSSFLRLYGNKIAVIIDCFEVFIVKPANMLARAITWSYYKHHNTVKFLIGIAPQGNIIYISKGWGGRVSDKHMTENCGFLDKITCGDVVMADRGFNIAESLDTYNSSLLLPAFTRGKDQLTMLETEDSRNIANLRINVERVIGLVRAKYTILNGTLPMELLVSDTTETPLIDEIALVCCALVNMCPTIVGQD